MVRCFEGERFKLNYFVDGTTTGAKLATIWNKYIAREGWMAKPLNFVVMIDNVPGA
jgi:hypothetical protein